MNRIVRVSIDLMGSGFPDPQYQINIVEQVRRGPSRVVCDVLTGDAVREGDLALPLQIMEDVFISAIGRTLGIYQTLDL